MIRFAHPEYLYALAVLPVLAILYFWAIRARKHALMQMGNLSMLDRLIPDPAGRKRGLKFAILFCVVGFVILAVANPQIGTKLEEVKREGVDIFIALDVSGSMKCEDIKPNRLENAKREIADMLYKLQNDRIGLVVFGGDSYLQLPLTTDYSAARLMLGAIDVDAVPVPGTAIGSAIKLAQQSFVAGEKKHKVIIVITDGENHEDDAVAAAKEAAGDGVIVHTIGMGTPEGGPIPIYENGVQTGFKKDVDGSIVVTKLDESALREIADAGGGKFLRGNNQQSELDVLSKEILSMDKKEIGAKVVTDYEDRFQYLLAPALLLLILEFFMFERKNLLMKHWKDVLAKPFRVRYEFTKEIDQ
jgi:Ca-activated chloride channel family protein